VGSWRLLDTVPITERAVEILRRRSGRSRSSSLSRSPHFSTARWRRRPRRCFGVHRGQTCRERAPRLNALDRHGERVGDAAPRLGPSSSARLRPPHLAFTTGVLDGTRHGVEDGVAGAGAGAGSVAGPNPTRDLNRRLGPRTASVSRLTCLFAGPILTGNRRRWYSSDGTDWTPIRPVDRRPADRLSTNLPDPVLGFESAAGVRLVPNRCPATARTEQV
jgi:hypothetical protein